MFKFRKAQPPLPDSFQPRLRDGVQFHDSGDLGFMLSVNVGKFTRISEQGAYIVSQLDGDHSLADLRALLQSTVKEPVPLNALEAFVVSLAKSNFLEDAPEIEAFQHKRKFNMRKILHPRLSLLKGTRIMQSLANLFGKVPYSLGFVVMILLLLNGIVSPLLLISLNHVPIVTISSGLSVKTGIVVMSLIFLEIVCHELGHGVVLTMFGATVRGFGLGVHYFLIPFAFTDTSDSYRLKRHERILVSLAGPAVDLVFLGVTAVSLFVLPPDSYATHILTFMMGYQITVIIWNLNFFLPLDGYYIVADLLNEPALRQQGIRYWIYAPLRWIRINKKKYSSRQHIVYSIYGALLITYLAIFLISAFSAMQFSQQLP